jgi:exopolysaccharide biosynthesis predicted pyruvyltransferase EpsI
MLEQKDIAGETIASKQLLNLFQRFSGHKIIFVEPGGNFGDYLIYKGAFKLAALAGLRYESVTFAQFQAKSFAPDEVVYIHGSGGFVPMWSGTPMKILAKLAREFKGTVILGPSTFSEDADYVKTILHESLDGAQFKKLFIFVRELTSYKVVQRCLAAEAELLCDHDTALNLVRSDLTSQTKCGKHVLYAIRQDKERLESQSYNYVSWVDLISVCPSFDEWVRCHGRAKKIVTNRTHSTIMGSILGIPTVMLPNSYHKNRSIWEYSLEQRGVQWVDRIDCDAINEAIENNAALKKFFTSRLYRKLSELKFNVF